MWAEFLEVVKIERKKKAQIHNLMCHHCKHIGLAGILANRGQLDMEKVKEHFIHVSECTPEDFTQHKKEAWEMWGKRNEFVWTTELGNYTSLIKNK